VSPGSNPPLMMAVTDQTIDGPQASYYDFVVGGADNDVIPGVHSIVIFTH